MYNNSLSAFVLLSPSGLLNSLCKPFNALSDTHSVGRTYVCMYVYMYSEFIQQIPSISLLIAALRT